MRKKFRVTAEREIRQIGKDLLPRVGLKANPQLLTYFCPHILLTDSI